MCSNYRDTLYKPWKTKCHWETRQIGTHPDC